MEIYKLEEVTVLVGVGFPEEAETQQGKGPGARAAKSSESREGE